MRFSLMTVAMIIASGVLVSCTASASAPSSPTPPTATSIATIPPVPSPTPMPTATPTALPTHTPTAVPTAVPTASPTSTKAPAPPTAVSARSITYNNIIVSGPASDKVAITFDMGSTGGSTLDLLQTLKSNAVRATFFVTGGWAEQNQSILTAIVAGGHEIANHSYTHPDFTGLKPQAMLDELNKTEALVQRVAGVSTKPFFRPPFGAYDQTVIRVVSEAGYRAVYWTLDGTDWRDDSTVASVVAQVQQNTGRGAIVVMHGALQKTAEAMQQIIPVLKGRGLYLTTLSDLLSGY